MAGNDRRRQKKLEKKNARRKEKKKVVARQEAGGLPAQFALAVKQPISRCWISEDPDTGHTAAIVISRPLPGGLLAFAIILVDRWCLGAYNVEAIVAPRPTLDEFFETEMNKKTPGRDVPPEDVYKLILGAVQYAHELGFEPHEDYDRAMMLFEGVDPAKSKVTWEFGHEGMPYYLAPADTPHEEVRANLAILTKSCGENGFRYAYAADRKGREVITNEDEDFGSDGWLD